MSSEQAESVPVHDPEGGVELVPQGKNTSAPAPQDVEVEQKEAVMAPSTSANALSIIREGDFHRTHLTIAYRNVSKTVQVSNDGASIRTMVTPFVNIAKAIGTCGKSMASSDFHRVHDASGILRPGTMTLVLAPPGHGKSTFLKVLSSRITHSTGDIVYNGFSAEEAHQRGCNTRRLTQYVDQVDEHLPLLTVTETLDFAHRATAAHYDPNRVANTISLLGLDECKDTILGNALIRGVSGGQKRRVTLGEMLVGDACALFLDEYTNGLDTATSEDITRGLKAWVAQTHGMVVTTLQQPTPGLYAMFDNIIVMKDAEIVYDGPREDLLPYFASMGFNCPDDVDVCDFIIDCLSQPRVALQRLQDNDRRAARSLIKSGQEAPAPPMSWQVQAGELQRAAQPCVTGKMMTEHYKNSPMWRQTEKELSELFPDTPDAKVEHAPLMPSPETKDMYQTGYTLPFSTLFGIVFRRQWKNFIRNTSIIFPRVFQAIVMGLLYGSVYWRIPTDSFYLRIAILLICQTQVGFGSMVELAASVEGNAIVFKQSGAAFYPTYMYVLSAAVCGIPMFVTESILFSVIVYFMSDCVDNAARFFVFYAFILLTCFMMSVWFRMLSATAKDEPSAHAVAGPSTGIFIMFGGFFVTPNNLPDWMIWMFWISPFSWSVRSLANNEFLSDRYNEINDQGVRLGNAFMQTFHMKEGEKWIGLGALYLAGFAAMCILIHAILLYRPNYEASIGTTRFDDEPEMLDNETDKEIAALDDAIAAEMGSPAPDDVSEVPRQLSFVSTASLPNSASSFGANTLKTLREALPFTPTWMTFSNVSYTVKVKDSEGNESDRLLLRNVNGYAEPGKLTALMGASGAGKTTLLDVLAGRKNMGVIEGNIMLNGRTPSKRDFATITGYVEQFDTLLAFDTVRETLAFAAHLRLPNDVAHHIKEQIVDEILDILDLTSIADRIVGNAQIPGLSPSQLKRVNIGCELVANPSVLFLDEPTTGLDSRAAQTVMRVVRRIARSGRSVICTIHQPSAELFYLFDRLVLLASGGHQIFFGDLGTRSRRFIRYLESVPKVNPIPSRYNPASWMLEELGVGVSLMKEGEESSADKVARFKAFYAESAIFGAAMKRINAIEALSDERPTPVNVNNPVPEPEVVLAPAPAPDVLGGHSEPDELGRSHSNLSEASGGMARRNSFSQISQVSAALPTAQSPIPEYKPPSLLRQLWLVFARTWRSYWRNPPMLFSRFVVLAILSILFGCIYFDINVNSQSAATSLIAALSVGPTFGAVTHASNSLPVKLLSRSVFYRETSSGMYTPWLWTAAGVVCDLFWAIPGALILQIPMYFMVGMQNNATAFFKFFFATYVFCVVFVTVAICVSTISPTPPAGNIIMGLFFSLAFTFQGVAIPYPKVPRGYVWLFRMLPVSHLTESLVMPQFDTCSPLPGCSPMIEVIEGTSTVMTPIAQYVMDYLGFTFAGYWDSIGWAVLFIAVLLIISFVATSYVRFDKR